MSKRLGRGRPPHPDILTPAEWRVVDAVRHGLTNQEIAKRLGVTVDAVKYHLANAREKTQNNHKNQIKHWPGHPNSSPIKKVRKEMPDHYSLGQVSRSVSDINQSKDWYESVLGLTHLYSFGNMAFFDCGGSRLLLSQEENGVKDESILYLKVKDIQSAYGQLKDKGVDFLNAPHMVHKHDDGTEEWMVFFNDPDGRPLGIMSQVTAD